MNNKDKLLTLLYKHAIFRLWNIYGEKQNPYDKEIDTFILNHPELKK